MKMNRAALAEREAWAKAGVRLPAYDVSAMVERTKANPIWVHFGAGNIFRGFIAALQQRLLDEGLADRGIIAADTFDYEIITKIYDAFDNLTMNVTLNPDATTSREIIASVAEGLRADAKDAAQMARFAEIFVNPSLQMVSFTITEKGYALRNMAGELMPVVQADMSEGPASARHAMSIVAAQADMEKTLVDNGMTIIEVDKEAFKEAVKPAYEKLGWTELRAKIYEEAGI